MRPEPGETTARLTATPPWRRWAWPAAVGLAAGFLSGLFGVGGGILLVPGLVLLLDMDQRRAHGTSLAAIIPIAAAGVIGYAVHGSVDLAAAALLAAGSAVGAAVGVDLLKRLSARLLALAFAALMLATALRLFLEPPAAHDSRGLTVGLAVGLVLIGIFAGVLAGLLGVGGGIVVVPALVLLLGLSDVVAKGTSLLVIIPTAVAGTVANLRPDHVDLRAAATAGLAGVPSALLGAVGAVHLEPRLGRALFALLLVGAAIQLVLKRMKAAA